MGGNGMQCLSNVDSYFRMVHIISKKVPYHGVIAIPAPLPSELVFPLALGVRNLIDSHLPAPFPLEFMPLMYVRALCWSM